MFPTQTPAAGITRSWTTAADGWLNLERLLYAAALLAAGWLRLYGLGADPLLPVEAGPAWWAWLGAVGLPAPDLPAPPSALLYTVQRLLFWLGGGSDLQARLLPALAGTLLVLLPWFLRPWLGRGTALLLACYWALDPWLLLFSRTGSTVVVSLVLALLVLISLLHLLEPEPLQPQRLLRDPVAAAAFAGPGRWGRVLALCLGLLLISGPATWSLLPVLLIAYLAWTRTPPGRADGRLRAALRDRRNLLLLVAAAILGGTGWLAHLHSVAFIGSSLAAWGRQLGGPADPYPLGWVWLRLLADQPFVLLMGLTGLLLLWRTNREQPAHLPDGGPSPWPIFLTLWAGWGALLLLLPGRSPESLLILMLPLQVAAAWTAQWLLSQPWRDPRMREAPLLTAILLAIAVAGSFWLAAYVKFATLNFAVNSVLSLLLLVALLFFFAWWSGLWMTWRVAAANLALALLLLTVSGSWKLNYRADGPGPLGASRAGFFGETSHPLLRQLVADVKTLSAQRVVDSLAIEVQAVGTPAPDPVVAWSLREMRNLRWVLAPEVAPNLARPPLVLLTSEESDTLPPLPAGYVGSRYPITRRWLPTDLADRTLLLRWFLRRDIPAQMPTRSITLWAPLQP